METYTPTPETRKNLIETYVADLITDNTPEQTLFEMCWSAVKSDFNGTVTNEQNEAVITFMVAFFANLTTHFQERFA